MTNPNQYVVPHTVHARIEIQLELEEMSVGGTMLDLQGLSSMLNEHLATLGVVKAGQIKVVEVSSPTKEWEIAAQLRFRDEEYGVRRRLDSETPQ